MIKNRGNYKNKIPIVFGYDAPPLYTRRRLQPFIRRFLLLIRTYHLYRSNLQQWAQHVCRTTTEALRNIP